MTGRFDLTGRAAVVTGALGRLGPVWIRALLDAGAMVAALDRAEAPISPAFTALAERYDRSHLQLFRAELRDRAGLEDIRGQVRDMAGTPHVLVNNAGIDQPPAPGKSDRLEDIPLERFREILDVNAAGTFLVTQVFGRDMIALRRGSIVNIGSLYATVAPDARLYSHISQDPPFLKPPAYGASKAALVNLTRYLAAIWAPFGVRVNALSPGGVLGDQDEEFRRKFSERVPMARLATAEDLGGPLVFLASEASSYVTGIDLLVDGGYAVW